MRITLYLLTASANLADTSLRNAGNFREVAVQKPKNAKWKLWVSSSGLKTPKWVAHVTPIVIDDRLEDIRTSYSSAVMLVEADKRIFAVTFGNGFHAIDPHVIERSFGLRVTANSIAASQIKSADTRGLNQTSRSRKTILPSEDQLYTLGIEPNEEWVRRLSGKSKDQSFATTSEGADSLKLNIKDFSLDKLPTKLKEIKARFEATDYRNDFGFLDNYIQLDKRDPVVAGLDAEVEHLLNTRDTSLGFAAPDPFEQLDVESYVIRYRKSVPVDDIAVPSVFEALDQLKPPKDPLQKVSVRALDGDGKPVDKDHDLYAYIQAEIDHSGEKYVLTAGSWFRVTGDYVKQVQEGVKRLSDVTTSLALPEWNKESLKEDSHDSTAEGSYNKLVQRTRKWALMDKKNIRIGGPHQQIEIGDLLTKEKEVICVKRASRSSTLSHLFAQGSVSAALMHIPGYQEKVMDHLRDISNSADFGNPTDWTFVYAIATDKEGDLADSLFFFSKVNLLQHAEDIASRGFKVALAKIDVV